MVKTQIQLTDELYAKVKKLAEQKEWSLAETLRRGAELLLERYPDPEAKPGTWSPPKPKKLGWRGLTHAEVHAAALADMEADPTSKR